MKHPALFLAVLLFASLPVCAETLVEDTFNSPKLAGRDLSPTRGNWKLEDGIATCTQDDALFAKNKSHGPIIWYDTAFTDATVRFSIRAEKVAELRLHRSMTRKATSSAWWPGKNPHHVRAWKEQGHEATAESLPVKDGPKLAEGAWVQAELKFAGDTCTIAFGENFKQTFTHPAIARKKTKLGLGFAFGTLSIRKVSIVTP